MSMEIVWSDDFESFDLGWLVVFLFHKGRSHACFISFSCSPTVFDIHLPFVSHFISIHLHFIYSFISPSTLLSTYLMRYFCEQHFERASERVAMAYCLCMASANVFFYFAFSPQSLSLFLSFPLFPTVFDVPLCYVFIICYFSKTRLFALAA